MNIVALDCVAWVFQIVRHCWRIQNVLQFQHLGSTLLGCHADLPYRSIGQLLRARFYMAVISSLCVIVDVPELSFLLVKVGRAMRRSCVPLGTLSLVIYQILKIGDSRILGCSKSNFSFLNTYDLFDNNFLLGSIVWGLWGRIRNGLGWIFHKLWPWLIKAQKLTRFVLNIVFLMNIISLWQSNILVFCLL